MKVRIRTRALSMLLVLLITIGLLTVSAFTVAGESTEHITAVSRNDLSWNEIKETLATNGLEIYTYQSFENVEDSKLTDGVYTFATGIRNEWVTSGSTMADTSVDYSKKAGNPFEVSNKNGTYSIRKESSGNKALYVGNGASSSESSRIDIETEAVEAGNDLLVSVDFKMGGDKVCPTTQGLFNFIYRIGSSSRFIYTVGLKSDGAIYLYDNDVAIEDKIVGYLSDTEYTRITVETDARNNKFYVYINDVPVNPEGNQYVSDSIIKSETSKDPDFCLANIIPGEVRIYRISGNNSESEHNGMYIDNLMLAGRSYINATDNASTDIFSMNTVGIPDSAIGASVVDFNGNKLTGSTDIGRAPTVYDTSDVSKNAVVYYKEADGSISVRYKNVSAVNDGSQTYMSITSIRGIDNQNVGQNMVLGGYYRAGSDTVHSTAILTPISRVNGRRNIYTLKYTSDRTLTVNAGYGDVTIGKIPTDRFIKIEVHVICNSASGRLEMKVYLDDICAFRSDIADSITSNWVGYEVDGQTLTATTPYIRDVHVNALYTNQFTSLAEDDIHMKDLYLAYTDVYNNASGFNPFVNEDLSGYVTTAGVTHYVENKKTGDGFENVLIDRTTKWKYLDDDTDPAQGLDSLTAWTAADYDDSEWKTGVGSFGSLNGVHTAVNGVTPKERLEMYRTDGTVIPTYFFRTKVTVNDPSEYNLLKLSVYADDAIAIYVNGTLILDTRSKTSTESNLYYATGEWYKEAVIHLDEKSGVIKKGENVIAVQLHNNQKASTDIYFGIESLTLVREDPLAAESVVLTIGATETEKRLAWFSNIQEAGEVRLVEASEIKGGVFPDEYRAFAASSKASVNVSNRFAKATALTGLRENTSYAYVIAAADYMSEIYYFNTGSFDEYEFVFFGDTQIGSAAHGAEWQDTVNKILSEFNADFLVSGGDQIDTSGSEEQYSYFIVDELSGIAVAPTVGPSPHDDPSTNYAEHFNIPNLSTKYGISITSSDYWYTYGSTLFMNINMAARDDVLNGNHVSFIREAIEANPDVKWRIVIMHSSLFSTGPHGDPDYKYFSGEIGKYRPALAPSFTELGIDVVLSGHDHVYVRSQLMNGETVSDDIVVNNTAVSPEGTLYVCANSSTGSKYYNNRFEADFVAYNNDENRKSVVRIQVTDTSFTMTSYFLDDMSVFDTFTIEKPDHTCEYTYTYNDQEHVAQCECGRTDESTRGAHTEGYACEVCGRKADGITSAIEAGLNLRDDVQLRFTLDIDMEKAAGAYAEVGKEIDFVNNNTVKIPVEDLETKTLGGKTYYVIPYSIAAKDITATVMTRLVRDGEVISTEYRYSAERYINDVLACETGGVITENLKELVAALDAYGRNAYAAINGGDSITVDAQDWSDISDAIGWKNEIGVKLNSFSLDLKSNIRLRVYFEVTSGTIDDYTVKINGVTVTPEELDGVYCVDYAVYARNLNKSVTISITDSEGGELYLETSPLYYAKIMVDKYDGENTEAYKNLMNAIKRYSDAAIAYANEIK